MKPHEALQILRELVDEDYEEPARALTVFEQVLGRYQRLLVACQETLRLAGDLKALFKATSQPFTQVEDALRAALGDLEPAAKPANVIRDIRRMTEEELREEDWGRVYPSFRAQHPICLELGDGSILFASADGEGNAPGYLFGVDKKGWAFRFVVTGSGTEVKRARGSIPPKVSIAEVCQALDTLRSALEEREGLSAPAEEALAAVSNHLWWEETLR